MTDWALTEALYPLTKKLHFLLVSTWYVSRVINLSGWTEDKDSKKQFKESRGDFAALNSDQGPAPQLVAPLKGQHTTIPRAPELLLPTRAAQSWDQQMQGQTHGAREGRQRAGHGLRKETEKEKGALNKPGGQQCRRWPEHGSFPIWSWFSDLGQWEFKMRSVGPTLSPKGVTEGTRAAETAWLIKLTHLSAQGPSPDYGMGRG